MTMWLVVAVTGYALGAIPFAYLVARWYAGIDVRDVGSGNVGAANVLRQTGWSVGLVVLALDMGKGALAAWLGDSLGGNGLAAVGAVAAVVGHVHPIWLGFKGGKGAATAAGAFFVLAPEPAMGAVIAFAAIVWLTRYVSLASIVAAVLLPCLAAAMAESPVVIVTSVIVGVIVLVHHRDNLARLRAGTERRLGSSQP